MYKAKEFTFGELKGLSIRSVEEHLKLYEGYVKHTNLILGTIDEADGIVEYELSEMQRRLAFEFGGVRNHEVYFSQLEGDAKEMSDESSLHNKIVDQWGSFESWSDSFKNLAKTRGVGWAMMYYDEEEDKLINHWVDEQHLGHLVGLKLIFALDMWEHSYVGDYWSSGKEQYIEDYFSNVNWEIVENRL
jgi:Fe-Mn family superoxide dismutase